MKKIKLLLGILMLAALAAALASPAFGAASPMNDTWHLKWFKLTVSSSGNYFPVDPLKGGVGTYHEKSIMYLRIDSVNEDTKTASLTQCSYDLGSAKWECEGSGFNYVGDNPNPPNPLDFLVYESFCNGDPGEEYCMSYTARVKGKMKNGVLSSASIKSIGGVDWDKPYMVGKVTFSGSLVPVSKLPFTPPPAP